MPNLLWLPPIGLGKHRLPLRNPPVWNRRHTIRIWSEPQSYWVSYARRLQQTILRLFGKTATVTLRFTAFDQHVGGGDKIQR